MTSRAGAAVASGSHEIVLEVSGLCVALGNRPVIRDLDLAIRRGECVGLIGPNGSGKSTLLKGLMGLLRGSGSGRVDRQDLFAMTERDRAKLIAYLPQDPDVVWPIAVEDLVMLGRAPHRNGFAPPSEADKRAVSMAIATMDLDDFRRRSARALSGGERARVLIARALAQETPVLLADEPTAGLDPAHQIGLMQTFRDMAQEGRSVLTSMHDLALAAQWCDRLLLLEEGRIAAAGAPEAVLTPDNLARVYGVEAFHAKSERGPIIVPVART